MAQRENDPQQIWYALYQLLPTKSSQLAALRAVQSKVAISYKILLDEMEQMRAML